MVTNYYYSQPSCDTVFVYAKYDGKDDLIIGFTSHEENGIRLLDPIKDIGIDNQDKHTLNQWKYNVSHNLVYSHDLRCFSNHEYIIDADDKTRQEVFDTTVVQTAIFEMNAHAIADCVFNLGKCFTVDDTYVSSVVEKRFKEIKEEEFKKYTNKLRKDK